MLRLGDSTFLLGSLLVLAALAISAAAIMFGSRTPHWSLDVSDIPMG